MTPPNDISRFLDHIHRGWETTKGQFPNNTRPPSQWPIPFFGNPATARAATIGVNPSSDVFFTQRNWTEHKNAAISIGLLYTVPFKSVGL